ncbi:MAG: hypothetical protein EAZ62_05365 [Sphingobacteriia bacterium]|nr:MAG: hypothetical protein EAZ62_05365 [Sphingobacteriia bacterium]
MEKIIFADPALAPYLKAKDSLRIQIVYTQIDRSRKGKPVLTEYRFNPNNDLYFYPASTVKMPIAFLALEKLNELKVKGLTAQTTMLTDSGAVLQDRVWNQPNAADGRPTIENYIKQIFLVSDNDAYNRLYEFLGQDYIRQKLTQKGYPDAVIRHRLELSRTPEQNAQTNPISFFDTSLGRVYEQPLQTATTRFNDLPYALGKGYLRGGKLVNEPFSFATKNRVYLPDLHHMLQSVMFPEQTPKKKRFNLTPDQLALVKKYMGIFPRESDFPHYDSTEYYDAYCKFLYYGSERGTKDHSMQIYNKVGDAYGFLIDVTYVVDTAHQVEFLLSATIHCNADGIFNDGKYEYESVGYPFMKALGQAVYAHELKRKKQ